MLPYQTILCVLDITHLLTDSNSSCPVAKKASTRSRQAACIQYSGLSLASEMQLMNKNKLPYSKQCNLRGHTVQFV